MTCHHCACGDSVAPPPTRTCATAPAISRRCMLPSVCITRSARPPHTHTRLRPPQIRRTPALMRTAYSSLRSFPPRYRMRVVRRRTPGGAGQYSHAAHTVYCATPCIGRSAWTPRSEGVSARSTPHADDDVTFRRGAGPSKARQGREHGCVAMNTPPRVADAL
jgi:hypothetical protein